ncbi:hypothetical protein [Endozoicomonas sp. Mp262]|uniref:hypothetical protein n=1 Tax=Endozoicomonas sp. Mp262 TaxID=2919499 RepID=UPI0021D80937
MCIAFCYRIYFFLCVACCCTGVIAVNGGGGETSTKQSDEPASHEQGMDSSVDKTAPHNFTVFVPCYLQTYPDSSMFGVAGKRSTLGYIPADPLGNKADRERFFKLMKLIRPRVEMGGEEDDVKNNLPFIGPFRILFLAVVSEKPLSGLRASSFYQGRGWVEISETILFDFIHSFRDRLTGDYDRRVADRKIYYRDDGRVISLSNEEQEELKCEYSRFLYFIKKVVGSQDYPGDAKFLDHLLYFKDLVMRDDQVRKPPPEQAKLLFEWLLVYFYDLLLWSDKNEFERDVARFITLLNFIEPFSIFYRETAESLVQLLFWAHGKDLFDFEVKQGVTLDSIYSKSKLEGLLDQNTVSLSEYLGTADSTPLTIPSAINKPFRAFSFLKVFSSLRKLKSRSSSELDKKGKGEFLGGENKTNSLERETPYRIEVWKKGNNLLHRSSKGSRVVELPELLKKRLNISRDRRKSVSLTALDKMTETSSQMDVSPCSDTSSDSDVFPLPGTQGSQGNNIPAIIITPAEVECS